MAGPLSEAEPPGPQTDRASWILPDAVVTDAVGLRRTPDKEW